MTATISCGKSLSHTKFKSLHISSIPFTSLTMTVDIKELDAHEQPSDQLRAKWKAFSRTEQKDVLEGNDIDDLLSPEKAAEFVIASTISAETLNQSFKHVCPPGSPEITVDKDVPVYYHPLLPGTSTVLTCADDT